MTTTHRPGGRKFVFLLASTRQDGNTEMLARQAAAALPDDVEQQWLRLKDLPVPAFVDSRHDGAGIYPQPVGNARVLLDATLSATDLVIASPLYWYSLSASAQLYLDHWSGWMRVPGLDFKPRMAGRTMWGITAMASEDRTKADPLIGTLRHCADYMGMHWGGSLLGLANAPGTVLADSEALCAAGRLFLKDREPVRV
ncbi:NAD(P)H-dependent oxidoreductase [Streptomyces sp. NPDC050448]|uniref:flavodoxin family protein n=1 Tax=Streptomyces sp. NPDC050448 TaxID=3155404 RepID=UPI00343A6E31